MVFLPKDVTLDRSPQSHHEKLEEGALQTDSLPIESIGKPSEDRKEAYVRRQKGESPWIENRDA